MTDERMVKIKKIKPNLVFHFLAVGLSRVQITL